MAEEFLNPLFKLSQMQQIEQLNSTAKLQRDFALSLIQESEKSKELEEITQKIIDTYLGATASAKEFNEVLDNSTDSSFIARYYLEKVGPKFNNLIVEYDRLISKIINTDRKRTLI